MKPRFEGGSTLLVRIPPHEFTQTLSFYRDILQLEEDVSFSKPSLGAYAFCFGAMRLVLCEVDCISRTEIWLHLATADESDAAFYLAQHGVVRRDEIAPLPDGDKGFWISAPGGLIHLVSNLGQPFG
ncbi:glyoxalase/bleomycin resistance/dioxygenase family protein [Ferrimonas futtsuensis]|uniref:glyoxalase/bleomycin resistance/dioxygenase family protein n=1 Tax=Ferrimonas futtsuensis TaxID=364764 RepID=UPI0003F63CC7|nr:glyoxalase/bleomycin resistance/dioxygenase family protein [Ferrimonas futtsuensis]